MSVSLRPTCEPDPENSCRNSSRYITIVELPKAIISKYRKTIKNDKRTLGDMIVMNSHDMS